MSPLVVTPRLPRPPALLQARENELRLEPRKGPGRPPKFASPGGAARKRQRTLIDTEEEEEDEEMEDAVENPGRLSYSLGLHWVVPLGLWGSRGAAAASARLLPPLAVGTEAAMQYRFAAMLTNRCLLACFLCCCR